MASQLYNPGLFRKNKPSVFNAHYKLNLLKMIPKWN